MNMSVYLDIYAVGGTSFDVRILYDTDTDTDKPASMRGGVYIGRTEFGSLDPAGQYHGDDDEIIEHVRGVFHVRDSIPAGVR